MKLLFDEMLSHTLPELVDDLYPGSVHVRDIDMKGRPDLSVWHYARDFDFVVTSKDKDHLELQARRGSPPKLIAVKIGNAATQAIADALRAQYHSLIDFHRDPRQGVYELY